MKYNSIGLSALALLALGLTAPAANAQTPAYTFTSAPVSHDSQLSLGFVFSTNSQVVVGALGYYDEGRNGFSTQHTVGIFDSSGVLLTSTVLSAGTGETLNGDFRYKDITPFVLAAGDTYTLVATTEGPADGWAYGNTPSTIVGFAVDPSISIANNASRFHYQNDDILRDPDTSISYTVYAGPDFQIDGAGTPTVPEPGSVAFLISGCFGCGLLLRRCTARK